MPEPLSPRNAEVARLRALARNRGARHEAGRFLVEGAKLVTEAFSAGLDVYDIYARPDWQPDAGLASELSAQGIEPVLVSDRGIERNATTTSAQPVVAELAMPAAGLDSLSSASSVLVVVDLNDPGNLGTLARSAVAAGFDAIVCLGDSVDPYSPKVIRSSAGALFGVPVVIERNVTHGFAALAASPLRCFGTRMIDATPCDEADLTGAIAIVLGSEAHGLGESADSVIDEWIRVPMPGNTESLNVAMAGTILTYETARQRRQR